MLSQGTLEMAQQAVGVSVDLPRYLPTGMVRDESVRYYARAGRGMVQVGYRAGLRHLSVEYHKPADEGSLPRGEQVRVGAFSAVVYTQPQEPSDSLPPMVLVAWRDGDVMVRVSGDLPRAELLKVARSIYPAD